jgi:hypothetical protein
MTGDEKVELSERVFCERSSLEQAPAPSKNTESRIGLASALGASTKIQKQVSRNLSAF